MSQQPSEALEEVVDEQSFIDFLGVLAADRDDEVTEGRAEPSSPYGPGKNGWENGTIEAFLWAAAAWGTSSINGMPLLPKSTNPWRRCADILYAGKIYE
jgi:hypothetical protein